MTEFLAGFPGPLALLLAAAVLAAESGLLIGIFLPGAGLVVALGWLAGHGVLEVWAAIGTAAAASAGGAQLGYLLGGTGSGRLRELAVRRFGADRIESAVDGRAVAAAQALAVARTVVPRLAARSGVGHLRFTACTAPVALAWSTAWVLLGAWSGAAYEQVRTASGLFGVPLLLVIVLVALVVRWARRRTRPRG
ncbi:hypothetical protein [Saccharopolyspora cebuensis]|uniref:DedA family protein n=1 Tax=Saccharopolyspora cebuensis TaxID=418759 RepID=A0ABV4CJX7_9PSEU